MQAPPRFHKQRLIFAEQIANLAKFSSVEAVVFDNPPNVQLNESFIATLEHMRMRGLVVLAVDYYIVSMPLPVQYCDHVSCSKTGAPA